LTQDLGGALFSVAGELMDGTHSGEAVAGARSGIIGALIEVFVV